MQRRLAAILAADMVGYSALMHRDEAATLALLGTLVSDVLTPTVVGQAGHIVKSMGDGWLVRFDSAAEAVTAALQIQEALAGHATLALRIGVHIGDVVETDDDVFGDGVNIAARLEGLARPGGIAISEPVLVALDRTLSHAFTATGPQKLKNIDRVLAVWEHVPSRPVAALADTGDAGFPRLTIQPVACSDPRDELQDLAAALTSDFGTFFRTLSWLRTGIASAPPADGYHLKAALRARGARMRLEARLFDGGGAEVWAQKFEGALTDSFDWQDRVGEDLSAAVSGLLIDMETRRLSALAPDQMTAEQCLLKGMMVWSSAAIDTYADAMAFHARAIAARPDLAAAYGEAIQVMNGAQTYGLADDLAPYFAALPGWIEVGRRMAGQNPLLDLSIAIADYRADGKADRLATTLDKIQQRAPLDARILTFIGWAYNWSGHPDNALDCFLTAMRLGRHGPVFVAAVGGAATSCVQLGRDRDAIAHAEVGLRFSESYPALHSTRAAAYAMLGESEKAAEALDRLAEVEPGQTISLWRSCVDYGGGPGAERYFEGMRRAGMAE